MVAEVLHSLYRAYFFDHGFFVFPVCRFFSRFSVSSLLCCIELMLFCFTVSLPLCFSAFLLFQPLRKLLCFLFFPAYLLICSCVKFVSDTVNKLQAYICKSAQIHKLQNKQASKQAGRQAGKQTNEQTNKHTNTSK